MALSTATSFKVSGLTNGTAYQFRIAAHNAVGDGPATPPVSATPVDVPPVATVPGAPSSLVAAVAPVSGVGSGEVRLSWSAPASNGGSPLTDYVIERSPAGGSVWTVVADGVSTSTSHLVSGLANGTAYQFRVSARNVVGDGPPSVAVTATPRTVPTAPRSLAAAVAPTSGIGSGQVRLTWTAPSSTGGSALTDYVVQRSANGTSGWTTISDGVHSTTGYTVTGLPNGTRYYFRVLAKNAVGTGPASNVVNATPRTVPTAPRWLVPVVAPIARVGSGQVRLLWLPPSSTGGSAITDYVIQRSANGRTGWVTINDGVRSTTGYTVTGLTNGTRYYFRVLAKNAVGTGSASNVVNAIPRTVPTAPGGLLATPRSRSVTLAWNAPTSTGGSAVTDYVIQRSTNGVTWTTVVDGVSTARTYTVTGLSSGVTYRFRVAARNGAGMSSYSVVVTGRPR